LDKRAKRRTLHANVDVSEEVLAALDEDCGVGR
jgi:hypothetical protein